MMSHTGFTDPGSQYAQIVAQMEFQKQQAGLPNYIGKMPGVIAAALDRIRKGQNATQRATAAVNEYEAIGKLSFHSAEYRKALHEIIDKRGGRVGNLITGERALVDWVKTSKPNISDKRITPAASLLQRTIRPSKNPDDRVVRMLENIAKQGYVLQKASNKKV
jgi:hypothetical protein